MIAKILLIAERALFAALGLTFFGFALFRFWEGDTVAGSASFGLGFLSFIYSNFARFKKFKGLGFEAELWEDKKKEAEALIEKLKDVYSIYTRELVISKAKEGRNGGGVNWSDRWKLYDDLVTKHNELGQKIDFSKLKEQVDDYYIYDIVSSEWNRCHGAIRDAFSMAAVLINQKFSSAEIDSDAYKDQFEKLNSLHRAINYPTSAPRQDNFAQEVLNTIEKLENDLRVNFGAPLPIDNSVIENLRRISQYCKNRPIQPTDEFNSWADRTKSDR